MCVNCQACESHCQACASTVRHVKITLSGMCVNCQACESHCQACASTGLHVNHPVRHVPGRHVLQLAGMLIILSGMCLKACESHWQSCTSVNFQARASPVRKSVPNVSVPIFVTHNLIRKEPCNCVLMAMIHVLVYESTRFVVSDSNKTRHNLFSGLLKLCHTFLNITYSCTTLEAHKDNFACENKEGLSEN
jgi:hypothetical protein